MARRVFFHIGAPKTGTTFLQTVMWHNRRALADHGLLYPGRYSRDHLHASQVIRGTRQAHMSPKQTSAWDRLVDELTAWPGTGLISHEFFSMATAEQAKSAVERLAPAEVHVVLTARDYVRQFAADWQESLKMNCDLSLDEFMERALRHDLPRPWGWNTHDLVGTLERWGTSVPSRRIHIITVPKPGSPRDLLWRRWCEVLELDPDAFDIDVAVSNESLGGAQAALLQRVKPHLSGALQRGPEKHRWLRAYFAHQVLLSQGGERFTLRSEHVTELRRICEEATASIDRAGYTVTGDLAELLPDPAIVPIPAAYPDDVPASELVDVATKAIEQMIRDVRSLTLERNKWRRRARGNRSWRFGDPASSGRRAGKVAVKARSVVAKGRSRLRG